MFSLVGIVVGLLISIGVGAVLRALTRTPQAEAGKLEIPKAEEGTAIPAVFGTVKLAPNIVWWGDVEAEPIKGPRRVFGLVGPRDTLGHKYHVGMMGALCWGQVDALVEIIVDQNLMSQFGGTTTRTNVSGSYVNTFTQVVSPALPVSVVGAGSALTITANNLFGGKEKEGGVSGTVRFYFGSTSQTANAYLVAEARNPYPAYPGLCYAVWEHTYLGTVPYLKHWQFVVRRCSTTLGTIAGDTTKSIINGVDANPAEILWELYTDTRWGLARSSTALDQASFLAALSTLKTENCGISGQFTAVTADDHAKEILRHIDGVLVPDPTTGLLRLKLIRADYVVADLLVFTDSSISELKHTRPQMPELVTEVKVNYTARDARYTQRTRAAYNPALRQSLGRAQSVTVSYPWFTTGTNAERAALRDLHAHSSEFATGTMVANRSAAYLAIGDPFIINVPSEGLSSVVCRVTRIDYGTIHERETVTVQWAEDVFGSQGGVYLLEPPDDWVEPVGTNAGQRFDVDTDFVLSATQGCLTLSIVGDISAITLVETQTQKGNEAAGGWVTQSNTAPITVCVDRADVHPGRIAYKISFTDGNGTVQTLEDETEVPPRGVYAAPRIDLTIDGGGAVTATVVPDGGVAAAVRCVGSTSAYPADATVDAGTPDTSSPFTFALGTLTAGQTLYVKAVATDASSRKSPYATAYIARSGSGVSDAQFLVGAAHADLTAERVVTDTATVTWDLSIPGQAKANAVPGGGGVIVDVGYIGRNWTHETGAAAVSFQQVNVLVNFVGTGTTVADIASDGLWMRLTTPGASIGSAAHLQAITANVVRRRWSPIHVISLKTYSSIADIRLWAGVASLGPESSDDLASSHHAMFRYSTAVDGTAFWRTCTKDGTTQEVQTTAVAVAADTPYLLRIELDASAVRFYIDGVLVTTHSTNLPGIDTNMGQNVSCTTLANAFKSFRYARQWGLLRT